MNDYILINNINNNADISNNNLGSTNYEFYISKFPVNNEMYCDFLNNIQKEGFFFLYPIESKDLFNQGITYEINKGIYKYIIKKGFKNKPCVYVSYYNADLYIRYLNGDLIGSMTKDKIHYYKNSEYWLPSYHEWYKSAYYNHNLKNYSNYPNKSDIIDIGRNINNMKSINSNNTVGRVCGNGQFNGNYSHYGVWDMAGNTYEWIRDDRFKVLKKINNIKSPIKGGSWNRDYKNSHKLELRTIDPMVYNSYIGFRICKKCPSKEFSISLYNEFGDGWKGDTIEIRDISGGTLLDKVTLNKGYGPVSFSFTVFSQKILIVNYNSMNNLFYENKYDVFCNMKKIYSSKIFKGNRNQQIIRI